MYVCLCNAITDKQLESLAAEGHRDAPTAYRALGGEVCCGRCLPTAEKILNTPQTENTVLGPFYSIAAE